MGVFNGLKLTNKGIALQAKLAAGGTLHYNRMAMGDGALSGSIETMTAMVNQKASLDIVKVKTLPGGQAVVGVKMNNAAIGTGFYFRELGVFAQDPDEGEILYLYGNAGSSADFIAPGTGGSDAIEKYIDVLTIIGNASSVTATINTSLVFITVDEFNAHATASVLDHPDGSVTDAKFGSRTIDDSVAAATGADTPTRLWSKLANMIKRITGKANWYTAPATTLETAFIHQSATTGTIHGSTSAVTAGTIMQRDANGRSKVAAPTASDDIARKDTVDGAISAHVAAADPHTQYLLDADVVTVATANKVLRLNSAGKLPASITGDAATVNGVQVRLNGTQFEYWNGTGWRPVGGAMYRIGTSNSVTVLSGTHTTVSNMYRFVGSFMALYPGELRVTFDLKCANSSSSPTAWLYALGISPGSQNYGGSFGQKFIPTFSGGWLNYPNVQLPLDTSTVVGTEFDLGLLSNESYNRYNQAILAQNGSSNTTLSVSTTIRITHPGPVWFVLQGSGSAGSTVPGAAVSNIVVKYDI